jgi:hypothetical protein
LKRGLCIFFKHTPSTPSVPPKVPPKQKYLNFVKI